jgi:hypothetical protein
MDQDLFTYLFGEPNISDVERKRQMQLQALRGAATPAPLVREGLQDAPQAPPPMQAAAETARLARPAPAPVAPPAQTSQRQSTSLRTTVKGNVGGSPIQIPEVRPQAPQTPVPGIDFEGQYADIDKRLAALDAPPDMSALQSEAQRRSADGRQGLLLALAAQQAGPGFQNIEQLMLKRAMAGRDPVRFTGGTVNEQGDVLNDPGFMEDKRRQELMRQRGGLENKQNAIVLGRERDAARADQRDRDRQLQAQIAAGQQGIASVMASIAQTNAETRADAARTKAAAGGKQAEQDAMMGTYLDAAENLLKQDPTGSGLGTAANVALSAAGVSTRKTQLDNQLKNVAGYLTSAVPRMQGPQSNYDVQLYQQMAGDVGNTSKPVADRLAAVQFMKAIHAGQAFMPGPDGRPVLKTGSAPAAPAAPAGGGGWSVTREP